LQNEELSIRAGGAFGLRLSFWRFPFDAPRSKFMFSRSKFNVPQSSILDPRSSPPGCARITLAKPTRRHDHNLMDSRRDTHVPASLPGHHLSI